MTASTPVDEALNKVVLALGGSPREGQHSMANAVFDAMANAQHLIVQAGTGTGKSLGYLVPAIVRAATGVADDGHNRTVVATATLALQRQLIEEDLPMAIAALRGDLKKTVSFAVLKGRHNYVCLDKFNRDSHASQDDDTDMALFEVSNSRLGKQAKALRKWVAATDTGDRDDYPHDIDGRLWRSVTVSGRECVGAAKCAWGQDCFAEKARSTAHASDIVVTNHALLVLDVIEGLPILPLHDVVVIDEAHELVDKTTNALAGSLDVAAVERAAKLTRKYVQPSTHERLNDCAAILAQAFDNIDTFGTVTRIEEVVGTLHSALTDLRDVCKVALNEVSTSSQDDPQIAAAKKRGKAELQELANVCLLLLSNDELGVNWLNTERAPIIHHAPLTVAEFLRESLFEHTTVILTSATLSVAGKMDVVARSVGLTPDPAARHNQDGVDEPSSVAPLKWTGLDVGSPFDYARQGILYCAAHLPAPSSTGVAQEALDELAELIEAAGGRTLSLFSSWRGVERAAEYLEVRFRGRDDRPLIVAQKGDSVSDLVRRFKQEPRSSLLGTVSLWQGIDVPGTTCTLVTIDRIPFPRPDDPVMSARSARIDAAGGSGFAAVQIPRAALLLAQGVGRLIRSTQDRGVVAILDSRLATKNYGSTLRNSLPALWYTIDKELVAASLRNLDAEATAISD
ncbi:MAG: ATP-dependent DNA helicase [Actinomycetes bacterium]